jgi:hypothetical protein
MYSTNDVRYETREGIVIDAIRTLLSTEREAGYELLDKEYAETLEGVVKKAKEEGAAAERARIIAIAEGVADKRHGRDELEKTSIEQYNAALSDLLAKIKEIV